MAPPIRVRFGRRVRLLRAKRDWDQIDLAAHAGISRAHVSHIERGTREVCLETIGRLAEAFEMDISELFQLPAPKNDLRMRKIPRGPVSDDPAAEGF